MILHVESAFYFGNTARWSYFWGNPNHAAAVICCAFPFLWCLERPQPIRVGLGWWRAAHVIVEGALYWLLIMTYSRGAAVALVAGILHHGIFFVGRNWSQTMRFWAPRLILLATMILATGFYRRFYLIVAGDPSALNRLSLWVGGLQLIQASPLHGWGKGNSGIAFMQWVQDPCSQIVHRGMVNSYLHIAVEFGIPFLCAYIFVLALPYVLARECACSAIPLKQAILQSCSSALVCFAAANLFTTLWCIPSVVWLPLLVVLVIIWCLLASRAWLQLWPRALWAAGLSMSIGGALEIISIFPFAVTPWSLQRLSSGAVRFDAKTQSIKGISLIFLSDRRTLGPLYGKQIRKAVGLINQKINAITIYPPEASLPSVLAGNIIALGPRISELQGRAIIGKVYVIAPTVTLPPSSWRLPVTMVALPDYDEWGVAGFWRSWAWGSRLRLLEIPGVGQDVRSEWSMVLAACCAR